MPIWFQGWEPFFFLLTNPQTTAKIPALTSQTGVQSTHLESMLFLEQTMKFSILQNSKQNKIIVFFIFIGLIFALFGLKKNVKT